jgi:hypothetical protein
MNVEELTQYLEDNKEAVQKAVLAKVVDSLTRQVEWSLPKKLQEDFDSFYTEEIRPAVKQHLLENKGEVMQVVIKACVDTADSVAKALAARITKTMSEDYYAKKVFEAMFAR